MSTWIGKIAVWLLVRQVQIEAKKGLTRENADRVRTSIINAIINRYQKALATKFTGDEAFWQFIAYVMDGQDGNHRLQNLADEVKNARTHP